MRIALCISGHLRNYKRMKPNYDKFMDYLKQFGDVDVFVSTWNKMNTRYSWSAQFGHHTFNDVDVDVDETEIKEHYQARAVSIHNGEFFDSIYSPLKSAVVIEHARHPDEDMFIHNNVVNGYKQFYIVHQSNLLKKMAEFEDDKMYDLVIRMRPDYFFDIRFMKTMEFQVEADRIYGARCGADIDDQFYYGDSFTMDRVMSAFLRVGYLLENWRGEVAALSVLIAAHHPSIQIVTLGQRPGVLMNDPFPEGLEYLDRLPDQDNGVEWYR